MMSAGAHGEWISSGLGPGQVRGGSHDRGRGTAPRPRASAKKASEHGQLLTGAVELGGGPGDLAGAL